MHTDAHSELRDALRRFLESRSSRDAVRALMDSDDGTDTAVWRQLAEQLGVHGIGIPEEFGGGGGGMSEMSVVHQEMGRVLFCAPFFSTIALAAQAVMAGGDTAAMRRLLPGFADGSSTGTLVLNGGLHGWDPAAVTLTAERTAHGFRIDGDAPLVLDGHTADVVLVAARSDSGISLFSVAGDAPGLHREPKTTLDRTRKIAALRFQRTPAILIGTEGAADEALARTSDLATIALTAEQLGGSQRCLEMAVDYAKTRVQFGRAIGSFQAIKHRCADMLVRVESARSAVMHAADVASGEHIGDSSDTARDELATAASVSKLTCSQTFVSAATEMMRIHGGIGFTWEHDAHLFVRRAKSGELMFGDPDVHAERLAVLAG